MNSMKPSLPQGTRDFSPEVVRKRNYILNTIRNIFELYGFQPLETPAMENLETLTGKYGEEGDKLMFKIINNGLDHPDKKEQARSDFEKLLSGKTVKGITERALKYDLTIPFARYVAMNHTQIVMPFKRYQIQPVWRADRPQKGRYREFYQCDADIVGSTSLLNEIELAQIYHDVFQNLQLNDCEIRINHRQVLTALAEKTGAGSRSTELTISIDKLDKIGIEKVKEELKAKDFNSDQIDTVTNYLSINGTNREKLDHLIELFGRSASGKKGIDDLEKMIASPVGTSVIIDLTLARGLNYYTGMIFEAKAPQTVKIGSIGGGGRYDDLTGLFGVKDIAGVGISFGVDRIYDVLEELKLFPDELGTTTQVLFFNLGESESMNALDLMKQLRKKQISCELFHEPSKFDKQFKYAEKKNIPWIVIIGSKELIDGRCTLKNLKTGEQETVAQKDLHKKLSTN